MEMDDKIQEQPITSGHNMDDNSLEVKARNNFIKKVYTILAIQLSVTVGFVILNMNNLAFAEFQKNNVWLFWVSFVVSLVSIIVLACVPGIATKSPVNVIFLSIFTLA